MQRWAHLPRAWRRRNLLEADDRNNLSSHRRHQLMWCEVRRAFEVFDHTIPDVFTCSLEVSVGSHDGRLRGHAAVCLVPCMEYKDTVHLSWAIDTTKLLLHLREVTAIERVTTSRAIA